MAKYDILIKNGMVFDGEGNPPRRADVGVSGGKIKAIGDLSSDKAEIMIDAVGKYIAPGFIDLTNHSDTQWTLFSVPTQESMIRQGVTTIIGGNCGSSLAPFVGKNTEEEISRWTDVSKMNINWNSMEEFLDEAAKTKRSVNFGSFVGYNTVIRAVLGGETKQPEEKEINQIKLLLKEAIEDGAFGISTNFGLAQFKAIDDSVLMDIFAFAAKKKAVIKHHLEDEGVNILPALSRAIGIAGKLGAKLHISHFKALGKKAWEFMPAAIKMINIAIAEKAEITCDFFPYTRTGSSLMEFLPFWFKKLSREAKLKVLDEKDGMERNALLGLLRNITLHYDRIIVASGKKVGNIGKTIETLAKDMGLSGEETVLRLLELNDLRVTIFNEVISGENIEQVAKENFSAVSSDGAGYSLPTDETSDLPHPRSFGTFPKVLRYYVKEKQILTWEKAIQKMTGLPASILGIKDRGILDEGNKADITVFDPTVITDKSDYENPLLYSVGVENVIINGEAVLLNGKLTGALPGEVLRRK